MAEKKQLLRSLTIDRQEKAESQLPGARSRFPGWAAAAAAAILVTGTALWAGLPRGDGEAGAEMAAAPQAQPSPAPSAPETAAKPVPQRAGSLIASGYVVARRKATIAAEVTGKVAELLVDEGVVVHQGQVLARLDSVLAEKDLALAQSRVQAAEAAIAAVTADLRDAERILKRTQTLSGQGISTEADLTKAQARTAVLRAQQSQAEALLTTAKLDAQRNSAVLDKHLIRAPFDGVVVERSAQPGEMISPMSAGGYTRTGICTIVDMDSIEIEVDVNEAFIGRIKPGATVNAVLDAYPDWTIPGSVIAIVPTANREKATVKVRIGLKQKDARILPDMAVKVTFLDEASIETRSSVAGAN